MNAILWRRFDSFKMFKYYRGLLGRGLLGRGLLGIVLAIGLTACSSEPTRTEQSLPISSIVQESKAGVPAKSIIRQIAQSGTVYRLSASQLADLRDEGVPNAVINYMQKTYIAAVRRNQSLIDRNQWFYGDGYWNGGYPYGWPYY